MVGTFQLLTRGADVNAAKSSPNILNVLKSKAEICCTVSSALYTILTFTLFLFDSHVSPYAELINKFYSASSNLFRAVFLLFVFRVS